MTPTILAPAVTIMLAVATSGTAQTVEIDAILTEALEDQLLMQTCSATLDTQTVTLLVSNYQDTASEVVERLDAIGFGSPLLEQMRTLSETGLYRLPDSSTFGEVLALCNANPDWSQRLMRFEIFDPRRELDNLGIR